MGRIRNLQNSKIGPKLCNKTECGAESVIGKQLLSHFMKNPKLDVSRFQKFKREKCGCVKIHHWLFADRNQSWQLIIF